MFHVYSLFNEAIQLRFCSGKDDDFLNGGFNPGKRCVNMWDDGCINGQLPGSGIFIYKVMLIKFDHIVDFKFIIGKDDDFLNGGFNPGKRCVNMWDDGCINGQIPGSGILFFNHCFWFVNMVCKFWKMLLF